MKHRFLVFGAAGTLALVVAVGAWASQDGVSVLDEHLVEITETIEPEATETPEATPTGEPEATATGEPEATATGEPETTPTAEPDPTETLEPEPTATEEPGDGDEDGDGIRGIPEDHPVFTEDDDGVCEKHEWRIKTTPSGVQVRVPCHAAGGDDDGEGDGEGDVEAESQESQKKGNGKAKGKKHR